MNAKTQRLSAAQMKILGWMKAGYTLQMSKRMADYGKYYLVNATDRIAVNASTADALYRSRKIAVDQLGLEVTFKLN